MKIAQIAPLYEAVPPSFYGGTERIVAHLTNALVELEHEVTLFASAEAHTRAARDRSPPPSQSHRRFAGVRPAHGRSAKEAGPDPVVTSIGHCFEPHGTSGGRNGVVPRLAFSAMIAARASPPISSKSIKW